MASKKIKIKLKETVETSQGNTPIVSESLSVPKPYVVPVKEQESKPVEDKSSIELKPDVKPEELKDLEKQFKRQEATVVVPVPKAIPREALLEKKMDKLTEEVIDLKNILLKVLDNQPKRLNLDFLKK